MHAYDRIRRSIVEGHLRPGQRLIEQRLAEELQLSRTPVREALRMLQSEGLVQFQPNRQARVRSISIDDLRDLYDLRSRLEGMAAELAAERATIEQLERLVFARSEFAASVRRSVPGDLDDIRGVFRANDQFHVAVLDAAHHDRLRECLTRTVDQTLVFQAFRHYRVEEMSRSVEFHGLITEAICHGEGTRASRLAFEHVLQGRDQLLEVLGTSASVDLLYDEPAAAVEGSHECC